jgi:hypothetical protein
VLRLLFVFGFWCCNPYQEKQFKKMKYLGWLIFSAASIYGQLAPLLLGLWWGKVSEQRTWWSGTAHLMAARKQRGNRKGTRPRYALQSHTPMTHFLQHSPTLHSYSRFEPFRGLIHLLGQIPCDLNCLWKCHHRQAQRSALPVSSVSLNPIKWQSRLTLTLFKSKWIVGWVYF